MREEENKRWAAAQTSPFACARPVHSCVLFGRTARAPLVTCPLVPEDSAVDSRVMPRVPIHTPTHFQLLVSQLWSRRVEFSSQLNSSSAEMWMLALVAKAAEKNGTGTRRGSQGSSKGKGKSGSGCESEIAS